MRPKEHKKDGQRSLHMMMGRDGAVIVGASGGILVIAVVGTKQRTYPR